MAERSRSQSPKRKVMTDAEYREEILSHNSNLFGKGPKENVYIVIQKLETDLYGESTTVRTMSYPSHSLWVALTCLLTAQRQFSLRNQPQTTRLGRLIFAKSESPFAMIRRPVPNPEDVQWFQALFPEVQPWVACNWIDKFESTNPAVNGHLLQAPIIMRPEFFETKQHTDKD